jgi:hypothetical protein
MLRMEGQSLYYDRSRDTGGSFLRFGFHLVHLEFSNEFSPS